MAYRMRQSVSGLPKSEDIVGLQMYQESLHSLNRCLFDYGKFQIVILLRARDLITVLLFLLMSLSLSFSLPSFSTFFPSMK